jgi:hypothetical protein
MTAHDRIHLFAAIGDLKDVDCQNTLAITTLIDLLVAKGCFTREEFAQMAERFQAASEVYQARE